MQTVNGQQQQQQQQQQSGGDTAAAANQVPVGADGEYLRQQKTAGQIFDYKTGELCV